MSLLPPLSGLILPGALKLLVSTLRITVTNPQKETCGQTGKRIFAFWHGKMIYGWLLAQRLSPDKTIHAIVSLSKDGEILSRTLEKLGFTLIRGSSSKGSSEVKTAMLTELANNGIIAITPDGPRGPRQTFKYGTLRLASAEGIPIIFATIRYSKRIQLKSWDRFEIPFPFSRVDITIHNIEVPEFRNQEELRAFEHQLSKDLADD